MALGLEMMRRMNILMMMGAQPSAPATLPSDLRRSQFVILKCLRQGYKNMEIKYLSIDENEVEKDAASLSWSGYLTKDNRLTSKGMEILGS